MMKIFRTLQDVQIGPSACAIGMFDGVHLGHHMVLEQAIRAAKIQNLQSVVFTFANHPQSVISQTPTPLLSTVDERLKAFEAFGFDGVLMLDFTDDLRQMTADAFIHQILVDTLHVKAVSIGYDHRFGNDRKGDGSYLQEQGQILGFDVTVVEPVKVGNQIVSSTLIRKLLSYGDLDKANQLLGSPYSLTGIVSTGVGRGRTIGFPTANIEPPMGRLIPAKGVYAGWVTLGEDPRLHPAMCNIGVAPTFGDQNLPRIEAHVLDYDGDLYGKAITFVFLHHLRDEMAFPSVDALIEQLQQDRSQTKSLLKKP